MFKKIITWLYKNFVECSDNNKKEANEKRINIGHSKVTYPHNINNNSYGEVNHKSDYKTQTNHEDVSPHQYSEIVEVERYGKRWWHQEGFYRNKPEDRKLKVGDAIVYLTRQYNKDYKDRSLMIVKGFDFDADCAARALIGSSTFVYDDGRDSTTYYSSFAPGLDAYRIATRDEIKKFINEYKKRDKRMYQYYAEIMKKYNNPLYSDLI